MIVDPIAHKLAQGRGTEEVVFAELNPDPIKFMTYGTKIADDLRSPGRPQPGRVSEYPDAGEEPI